MADADERSDIGKVVVDYTMEASFGDLDPPLEELRLVARLVDLLVGVVEEVRQRLLVLDPVGELSHRVSHQQARDDSVGEVVGAVDGVNGSEGASGEGHDHEVHEVPDMVRGVGLFLLQL